MAEATLGGGCFWCLEAVFARLRGVTSVTSGYCGGHVENPEYRAVCEGTTGHAEVVRVVFDEQVISFDTLLDVFFAIHDPTTLNRQGHDVGTQYRSVIFTHSPAQHAAAMAAIDKLLRERVYDGAIVTEVRECPQFYAAESYHQRYFDANPHQPYCMAVVSPKVSKLMQKFGALVARN